MKKATFVLLASVILLSCHKTNTYEPLPNPDNSIFGDWKYTENYVSPGTAWHWEKVDNGATLTVNQDSSYQVSQDANLELWPFSLIGTRGTLGITTRNNWTLAYFIQQATHDSAFFYPIRVNKDTLELAGLCIEGCIYRFRKTR